MSRRLAPVKLVFTLSVLALSACDESTTPSEPGQHASRSVAAAASYSAQDLEISGAGEGGRAASINASGQVAGYIFRVDDTFRGFLWSEGVQTDLGTLGGRETRASDINDVGQVVGSSETAGGRIRAFRWVDGTMRNLGTLGGSASAAFGINNRNHVVGQSRLAGDIRDPQGNVIVHAFLLKNGVMTDLGTLGGSSSVALDINDAGQIVGWSHTVNGTRHPFLWENGVMKDLLSPGSGNTGTAYAINSVGAVVGERNNRAFRYSGGVLRILPLGTTPSVATGIRGGRLVGNFGAGLDQRGFVLADGEVTVLPLFEGRGAEENEAWAINGAGTIAGAMTLFDGNVRPTIWTPQ
jgi:probable HAF family extracellular repeat protein